MAILDRIRTFLRSPRGRNLTEQGRRMAADPRRRAQARGMVDRLRRR